MEQNQKPLLSTLEQESDTDSPKVGYDKWTT